LPYIKKRPALVRWSSGSVAGSVAAKVLLYFEIAKLFFEEKNGEHQLLI
jgi:hypothetical protein